MISATLPLHGNPSGCCTSARADSAATGTAPVHTHSCTELFYCLSGEGQFLLSGQLFPVKPDDMVIVNPQVEHTELSLNASPLEYIVLGVSGIEILFGKADSTIRHLQLQGEPGSGW